MNKIWLLLFFSCVTTVNAQDDPEIPQKNEIRINVLSIITSGKFGISYERFLKNDFSLGINCNFSNSQNTKDDYEAGFRNNLPSYEVNPFIRYALSKSKTRFYFAEIFTSLNGGDFKEIVQATDENGNGFYTIQNSTYTDIALGGSLGYKMYFKEKIALELIVGFGKNLFNTDKSPDVVSRVGLNLGYRF